MRDSARDDEKKIPLTDEELQQATGGAIHEKNGTDCPKISMPDEHADATIGCTWDISCLWNKLTHKHI